MIAVLAMIAEVVCLQSGTRVSLRTVQSAGTRAPPQSRDDLRATADFALGGDDAALRIIVRGGDASYGVLPRRIEFAANRSRGSRRWRRDRDMGASAASRTIASSKNAGRRNALTKLLAPAAVLLAPSAANAKEKALTKKQTEELEQKLAAEAAATAEAQREQEAVDSAAAVAAAEREAAEAAERVKQAAAAAKQQAFDAAKNGKGIRRACPSRSQYVLRGECVERGGKSSAVADAGSPGAPSLATVLFGDYKMQ